MHTYTSSSTASNPRRWLEEEHRNELAVRRRLACSHAAVTSITSGGRTLLAKSHVEFSDDLWNLNSVII